LENPANLMCGAFGNFNIGDRHEGLELAYPRSNMRGARLFLIPGSEDTRGHGTVGMAKLWKQQLQELLETTPRRAM
jgi:hypothetical protein